jgi:CRISPR/Cas system-associated endonuclease Cas1
MHQDHSAGRGHLEPSQTGVLFVSGFATSLRVERGHLLVRSGGGRDIREVRIPKVGRPRLRRLVIFGRGGHTTFEALAWLDRIGASFLHLDRSGRVVAMSGQPGPDFPALRRAQVAAHDTDVGLSITKRLLGAKLSGQRTVVDRYGARIAERRLAEALDALNSSTDSRQALTIEAKAASVYWVALADRPVRFADADAGLIPERWSTVGERHSILSGKPRLAISPAHAILNFLYHLAAVEASLALLALGLDPGLGWAHRDTPYRDSAALDLVEAVRPDVDEYVLDLLAQRTFSRREFVELPTGQVRVASSLAKLLAESTSPPMGIRCGGAR